MDSEDFSCAFCLDIQSDNGDDDYFVSTECGHIFHFLCLKPAHESGYKDCPICRSPLDLQDLRKLYGLEAKSKSPAQSCLNAYQGSANVTDFQKEYDYKFKIILVGDAGVGKSCLLQRYADGTYNSKLFSTVGCDWRSKTLIVGGKTINLSMWDTVGQERHRSLVTNYVRDAHGALIVYDITSEDSFSDIEYWIDFVKNHGLQDCVKVLIGNKTDLDQHRQVPKKDGKALAQKIGIPFFETSAKDAYNVEASFRTLAAKILETDTLVKEIEEKKERGGTLRLSKEQYTPMNPIVFACSMGWQWTKVGAIGAARSIKSGWNSISSPSSRTNDHNH